ncbi:MAG: adenylosuccinate synthase [Candidatus Sericytochromatia bacterium]|nr:adenylosuccinate synthase [Candidatus Sericytochromatia bacterium]
MSVLILVGAQWGDEGKGKVTDWLAERANMVVRYQGGSNAGHTVIRGGQTFKLHLVPSGILYSHVQCVIGSGVVIDPSALLSELGALQKGGISLERLSISRTAHVTLPYHRRLDHAEERQRGGAAIGTTGRGIGPTYTDKVNRAGVRLLDLLDREVLTARLRAFLPPKNALLTQIFGEPPVDLCETLEEYLAFGEKLRPFLADVSLDISKAVRRGDAVLFEGAQGTMLDLDAGTYPFVTSSHPVAGGACLGTGIGPTAVDAVLGVTKAYTTRVGSGPFPTEMRPNEAENLRMAGGEFGTTTGRARRCGWLDAVVLQHAVRMNGLTSLALTKLDVLDTFSEVKLCVAYRLHGKVIHHVPDSVEDLAACEPLYDTHGGWLTSTSSARNPDDLPAAAQSYLRAVSAVVGVPISLVGVGPEREALIVNESPWSGRH